jgi:endonuclease YncB( thermonuclease family)
MGYLIVEGTLETKQFWPTGTADADTTTVKVKPAGFYYKSSATAPRKKLKTFEGAAAVSQGTRSEVMKKGRISVRLQGIDAPELHYRPTLSRNGYTEAQRKRFTDFNEDYRQIYAETGATKLGNLVKQLGAEISCTAISQVSRPTDVFDKYGRFVGDVVIRRNNKDVNLNRWVLENGLAIPGIYDSMTEEEIKAIMKAYDKGLSKLKKWYAGKVVKFNPKRLFRRKPANPKPDADAANGNFFLPKLFRRQALHFALKSSKITTADFLPYVATLRDDFMLLERFLKFGKDADPQPIRELLNGGALRYGPTEVVFKEATSRLLDSQGTFMDKWRYA